MYWYFSIDVLICSESWQSTQLLWAVNKQCLQYCVDFTVLIVDCGLGHYAVLDLRLADCCWLRGHSRSCWSHWITDRYGFVKPSIFFKLVCLSITPSPPAALIWNLLPWKPLSSTFYRPFLPQLSLSSESNRHSLIPSHEKESILYHNSWTTFSEQENIFTRKDPP